MSQWKNGVSCAGRQTEEGQNQEEASSSLQCVTSREKRRRQRENKSKTKELSEEEMMDLALQLSQQASVAALQMQKREEEDMMKAIQESIILQARCPQSPSLHVNEEAASRTCSQPKPSHSNGTIVLDDDECSSSEMQQTSRQSEEQKRKPGSSLQKKPDLVQTPDLHLEPNSPGSSDHLDLHSPQSSDSTLIDDSQPPRSPVFLSTYFQAEVVIPRLSQDLVHSCRTLGFVLCSPESHMSTGPLCNKDKSPTFSRRSQQSLFLMEKVQGDMRALSPEPCGFNFCSQDSLSSSVTATSCQSPVFPRTGPSSSEMGWIERSPVFQPHQTEDVGDSHGPGVEVMTTTNLDEAQLSSNMTLCWSDEDGEVTPVATPSPVFPAETESQQAASPPTGPNRKQERFTAEAQPISSQAASIGAGAVSSGSTVHYYWGIPFCPRGLDPAGYTQVIVAQMEVFEKSLKMAQRNLLRKADWGEGIEPQSEEHQENSESECVVEESEDLLLQRRLRRKKRSDRVDSPSAGAEEDNNKEVEQRESCQEGSKGVAEEDMDMETGDTEVPETQLSVDDEDERREDLIVVQDIRAELKSDKPPDVQKIVVESPPAEEEAATVAEVVRQAKGNSTKRRSSPSGPPPCDEEAATQDAGPPMHEVALDVQEVNVDCPICQGSFPVDQIEMHAAYCDGAPADSPLGGAVPVTAKPRRKRTRRCEAGDGASGPAPSTSREHMKCFICQSAVPVQDYGRHTDLCISRQDGASAAKENLLSALEKTDSRHSDVRSSGSRLQHSDVIDLRNDDGVPGEEEGDQVGGVSSITISNSPIRSFTPISEAKDCLIDFRRPHHSKKLGRRRR